jgi:hypothetical protein
MHELLKKMSKKKDEKSGQVEGRYSNFLLILALQELNLL